MMDASLILALFLGLDIVAALLALVFLLFRYARSVSRAPSSGFAGLPKRLPNRAAPDTVSTPAAKPMAPVERPVPQPGSPSNAKGGESEGPGRT